jgi:hypothetical protein
MDEAVGGEGDKRPSLCKFWVCFCLVWFFGMGWGTTFGSPPGASWNSMLWAESGGEGS